MAARWCRRASAFVQTVVEPKSFLAAHTQPAQARVTAGVQTASSGGSLAERCAAALQARAMNQQRLSDGSIWSKLWRVASRALVGRAGRSPTTLGQAINRLGTRPGSEPYCEGEKGIENA